MWQTRLWRQKRGDESRNQVVRRREAWCVKHGPLVRIATGPYVVVLDRTLCSQALVIPSRGDKVIVRPTECNFKNSRMSMLCHVRKSPPRIAEGASSSSVHNRVSGTTKAVANFKPFLPKGFPFASPRCKYSLEQTTIGSTNSRRQVGPRLSTRRPRVVFETSWLVGAIVNWHS